MKIESTQDSIALQFLLEQASVLSIAQGFWEKYVIPSYPEFELCDYWDDGAFVTLELKNADDNSKFEIYWQTGGRRETSIKRGVELAHTIYKILQMEVKE